jgi:ubiquitin-conjugating enzyme E2 Q
MARSTLNKPIGVPKCAMTTSKAFRAQNAGDLSRIKKRKHSRTPDKHHIADASDSDEMEDIQFLLSDDEGEDRGVLG